MPDPKTDKAALARKLVDPKYIRQVLRNSEEKNRFNLRMQQLLQTTCTKPPLVPRKNLGTHQPVPPIRTGSASDVLDALMGIPVVANAVAKVKNTASNKLERDWRRLSTGSKAAVIIHTFVIGATAATAAMGTNSSRKELYDLIRDREIPIPIPGVDGLELQLKTGAEHRAVIMFDVAKLWR